MFISVCRLEGYSGIQQPDYEGYVFETTGDMVLVKARFSLHPSMLELWIMVP